MVQIIAVSRGRASNLQLADIAELPTSAKQQWITPPNEQSSETRTKH
jgi:hypothetical protein